MTSGISLSGAADMETTFSNVAKLELHGGEPAHQRICAIGQAPARAIRGGEQSRLRL